MPRKAPISAAWPRYLGEPGGLTRIYYLATAPNLFVPIANHLRIAGLADSEARIVLEKPIGHSLASATAINEAIGAVFDERRCFASTTTWARKPCRT
jgi:glucose-6-phosphate 1-dehydrogenase (EC 1.1.1.49)